MMISTVKGSPDWGASAGGRAGEDRTGAVSAAWERKGLTGSEQAARRRARTQSKPDGFMSWFQNPVGFAVFIAVTAGKWFSMRFSSLGAGLVSGGPKASPQLPDIHWII
jgi:hypothetical protein